MLKILSQRQIVGLQRQMRVLPVMSNVMHEYIQMRSLLLITILNMAFTWVSSPMWAKLMYPVSLTETHCVQSEISIIRTSTQVIYLRIVLTSHSLIRIGSRLQLLQLSSYWLLLMLLEVLASLTLGQPEYPLNLH